MEPGGFNWVTAVKAERGIGAGSSSTVTGRGSGRGTPMSTRPVRSHGGWEGWNSSRWTRLRIKEAVSHWHCIQARWKSAEVVHGHLDALRRQLFRNDWLDLFPTAASQAAADAGHVDACSSRMLLASIASLPRHVLTASYRIVGHRSSRSSSPAGRPCWRPRCTARPERVGSHRGRSRSSPDSCARRGKLPPVLSIASRWRGRSPSPIRPGRCRCGR